MADLNYYYLNIPDLYGLVNQYLIGKDLNAKDENRRANLLGVDLFIRKPILRQLCCGGYILLVKKYIKKYTFDKSIIDVAFEDACSYGHLKIVRYLVGQGVNGHVSSNNGLRRACYYGRLNIVQYLIELGANNLNCDLIWACRYGRLNIVQFLVESGKKSNTDINEGLNNACTRGNFKIIEYLNECERKLNITLDFNGGLYSICSRRKFACGLMDTVKVAKYIIELGRKSNTVFDIAKCVNATIQYEDTQLTEYLLSF